MNTGELLCDICSHEGVCAYESTFRHYARELEVPKGPFLVDIFCTRRMPPQISVEKTPLPRGSSDEFIISKVWPEEKKSGRYPWKESK